MLSVIIPVFQREKYIRECVESVLKQTYKDIEIILVDDGSTDSSGAVCDEYADKNNRITVIHTENRGIYLARKKGVEVSRGEIVTFVDADDWIDENTYKDLMQMFYENDPDILCYLLKENKDGLERKSFETGIYESIDIKDKVIPNMIWDYKAGRIGLNPSLCTKLFKREVYLRTVRNIEDKISLGEDALIAYPAICIAKRILITDRAYYNYRANDSSTTARISSKKMDELSRFEYYFRESMNAYGDYDFSLQIDCYIRLFFDLLFDKWMGIPRSSQQFMFPFSLIPAGSRIALYGAGKVGRSYYCSIVQSEYAVLTGWFDSKVEDTFLYDNMVIKNPKYIEDKEFEYIIVSVFDSGTAEKIRDSIIKKGVAEKKIKWITPRVIG